MKSFTESELMRLYSIDATISDKEYCNLFDSEGADREKYFEFLEGKYGKMNESKKYGRQ